MTTAANFILRIDVRVGKGLFVLALRIDSPTGIHACPHMKLVNIITVRYHLRKEYSSAMIPSCYQNLINKFGIGPDASILPFIWRIFVRNVFDICKSADLTPWFATGVNQFNFYSSFCYYLQQIVSFLHYFKFTVGKLLGNNSLIYVVGQEPSVRLSDNNFN